jgi:long-chain acyl-CoA synthetase
VEHYKEESVGRILPEVDMKISEPDERGAGEIIVKGPMVMQGYYNMPEETAEVFTQDGYFRTGDVGYLDGESYLYITGRAKNLIVTEGGKNVYPEEIENEFQTYPEIDQIMVRGYEEDPNARSEKIEALIHPDEDVFSREGGDARETAPGGRGTEVGAAADRGDGAETAEQAAWKPRVDARIREIVAEVNERLLPYQRIDKVTILRAPLEMTTTKKIKRHTVE